MTNTIAIASDHAGVELKASLKKTAEILGYSVVDLGPSDHTSVDYPDFANKLCEWVLQGKDRQGVLICGSGIGMSIAANRHKGIRAALVQSTEAAKLSRQHNNANVLCIGARLVDEPIAQGCLTHFLQTDFEGGRHENRVNKLG
jgi:ribose 5-phosphate isomerase B